MELACPHTFYWLELHRPAESEETSDICEDGDNQKQRKPSSNHWPRSLARSRRSPHVAVWRPAVKASANEFLLVARVHGRPSVTRCARSSNEKKGPLPIQGEVNLAWEGGDIKALVQRVYDRVSRVPLVRTRDVSRISRGFGYLWSAV